VAESRKGSEDPQAGQEALIIKNFVERTGDE
jgi:hypothetical protein